MSVEKPAQVERESPFEPQFPPADPVGIAEVNYPSGTLDPGGLVLPDKKKILRPTEREMVQLKSEHGVMLEPEIATARSGEVSASGYSDDYPTHFNFESSVRRALNRVQAAFPWLTYGNTYRWHPPVYRRKYERVSMDLWGGGLVNGVYQGYRGKPIGNALGWDCFNFLFNDPHLPNIYWIIFNGWMWSRTDGWTASPWGPAGSDARHDFHVHTSFLVWW